MIDKKAKRCVLSSPCHQHGLSITRHTVSISALSLRVFHEDITFAGREAAAKLKAKQAASSGAATPTMANIVQEKEEGMTIEAVEKTEATVAMNEAP